MKGTKMRLLLCGGGTAGHINPAIAVAEEMHKRFPGAKILFVGREGGLENEPIEKAGFELKTIKIYGLKRSFSLDNFRRVFIAIEAKNEAERIIKHFNPDFILGTGGYVCWPVISAGRRLGIPTAIHESNVFPGLTTKLLAKRCDKVFLGHDETKNILPKKINTITVGNPLRADFTKTSRKEARATFGIGENEFFIVSFGGSIGAERLNEVIIDVIEHHSAKTKGIKHLHATGRRYFDQIKSPFANRECCGCKILPFIHNMPTALLAADTVICRSGAMTLSEISAVGVASILVPSPNVSANHQYKNAKYLADKGAAMLIEEEKLTSEILINALKKLENDKNGRKTRAKTIKSLSTPNSAKSIVNELILLKK